MKPAISSSSRCQPWRFRILMSAVGATLGMPSMGFGQTVASWISPISGSWTDPSKWSTNSVIPNNGYPTIGSAYSVFINAGTSLTPWYSVNLNSDIQISDLNLAASAYVELVGGTFRVPGGISLSRGYLYISGGTLSDTPVSVASQAILYLDRGTLNNVSLTGSMTLRADSVPVIQSRLNLNAASVILESTGTQAAVTFVGSQTITGNGELIFDGPQPITLLTNAITGIGTGILIRSGKGDGIIGTSAGTFAGTFINQGTIASDLAGRSIALKGNWQNAGTLRLTQGTLKLGGSFTPGAIGKVQRTGGTLAVIGTVNAADSVLDLSIAPGAWLLSEPGGTATLRGGTVRGSGSNELSVANAGTVVFDQVRLAAKLRIPGISTVNFRNGLVFDNGTVSIEDSNVFGSPTIICEGPNPIAGSGQVVFDGQYGGWFGIVPNGGTMTIGAGITIRTAGGHGSVPLDSGTVINYGRISADAKGLSFGRSYNNHYGHWINNGILEAKNGGQLQLDGAYRTSDLGQYSAFDGGRIELAGLIDNQGHTFKIDSPEHSVTIGGTFNGGTIQCSNGGTVTANRAMLTNVVLDTDLRVYGDVRVSGLTILPEHTLRLLGDNWETTLTLGSGQTLAGGLIQFEGGSLSCIQGQGTLGTNTLIRTAGGGGTINSGVRSAGSIQINPGDLLMFRGVNEGTITATQSTLRLGSGWRNSGNILLNNAKLELYSDPVGTVGNLTMIGGSTSIVGSLSLGQIDFAIKANVPVSIERFGVANLSGGSITLGPSNTWTLNGGTILGGTIHGEVGDLFIANGGTMSGVTLQTTLQQKALNSTLRLIGNWENQGTFDVVAGTIACSVTGASANFSGGTLKSGIWRVGPGATMTFSGALITTNKATIILDGPRSIFTAINSLKNNFGNLTVTNGSVFFPGGSLTNAGAILIGPNSTLRILDGIHNSSGLLDLNFNMVVDYIGPSPLDELVGQIGSHIISSAANADPGLAIGSMDDGDVVRLQLATIGDANLDGLVNYDDLAALANNYDASSPAAAGLVAVPASLTDPKWVDGDFNYDGAVNLTDLYALGWQYKDPTHLLAESLTALNLPAINVPEPMLLSAVAAGTLLLRRRRNV